MASFLLNSYVIFKGGKVKAYGKPPMEWWIEIRRRPWGADAGCVCSFHSYFMGTAAEGSRSLRCAEDGGMTAYGIE